jgi:hypothetical protein
MYNTAILKAMIGMLLQRKCYREAILGWKVATFMVIEIIHEPMP